LIAATAFVRSTAASPLLAFLRGVPSRDLVVVDAGRVGDGRGTNGARRSWPRRCRHWPRR
jgi:hypothetical protein